jgi:hypothetical protein
LLLGFAITYGVLRLRDSRNVESDPALGFKAALHFIYTFCILIFLTGLTVVTIDLLERSPLFGHMHMRQQPFRRAADDFLSPALRFALPMMLTSLLVGVVHFYLIRTYTDNRRWPETRRAFIGWRFVIASVVVLFSLTALSIVLFQQQFSAEAVKVFLGTLIVWGPAWLLHLVLMQQASRGGPVRAPAPFAGMGP